MRGERDNTELTVACRGRGGGVIGAMANSSTTKKKKKKKKPKPKAAVDAEPKE